MNNTNKKYYKHVYDKVCASDDLKERILNMGKNDLEKNQMLEEERRKDRKYYRSAWRGVAAVAALAIAIPSVMYAATRYWGVGDFYARINNTLTKEADNLIERDIAVQTQDKKDGQEMPVDFEVKEALCDSGCVSIVLRATAKEKGKYFLSDGKMAKESDSVIGLGIDEDMTIGEYAKSKGLDLLFVDYGFADEGVFAQSSYKSDCMSVNDDTLDIYLQVRKENADKDLDVAVECSVSGATVGKTVSSILNFKLQDKSTSEKALYAAEEKMAVKGTKAVVTKVTMETTEVHTYVKIYYRYPNKEDDDCRLGFRVLDEKGEPWKDSGGVGKDLGGGKYCKELVDEPVELPEKCILEVHDCEELDFDKRFLGQFEISKVK